MTCVSFGDPCSSVSKEDVDQWTNSLKKVLANQTAKKMFEQFLHGNEFDSANALDLWKMCDDLLGDMRDKQIEKELLEIKKKYDSIVQFAIQEVNGLTEDDCERLSKMLHSNGPKKIVSLVETLRQTAYDLMQHDYEEFKKKLIETIKE